MTPLKASLAYSDQRADCIQERRHHAVEPTRPRRDRHRSIAREPQIFGDLSVQDNLRLGAHLRRDGAIANDMERVFT